DHGVRRIPDLLGDDRLDLRRHPLMRRLQLPALAPPAGLRVAREAEALCGCAADQALHRCMGEPAAAPGTAAPVIQDLRDREEPAVLQEEVVHEAADGSLLGVGYEAAVLPAVAEGSRAAQGLAKLRPHRNR